LRRFLILALLDGTRLLREVREILVSSGYKTDQASIYGKSLRSFKVLWYLKGLIPQDLGALHLTILSNLKRMTFQQPEGEEDGFK